jgi:hypothetical protein
MKGEETMAMNRNDYIEKLEAKLAQSGAEIEKLKAKAAEAKVEARTILSGYS